MKEEKQRIFYLFCTHEKVAAVNLLRHDVCLRFVYFFVYVVEAKILSSVT